MGVGSYLLTRMYLFVVGLALTVAVGAEGSCPSEIGSCPVDTENVMDVFYFDATDQASCQHQCSLLSSCNNFTIVPAHDDTHTKCFLFKSCDMMEDCENFVSGGLEPAYYDCSRRVENADRKLKMMATADENNEDSYTCPTDVENIVAVYYFDVLDEQSCQQQCTAINECNYWTHWKISATPQPHHKCMLFKQCGQHEPCQPNCTNGPSL